MNITIISTLVHRKFAKVGIQISYSTTYKEMAEYLLNRLVISPCTVWLENLTGIKFDEIASKLHNKNMTDFKFDEMPGKKAHSIRKINIDGY